DPAAERDIDAALGAALAVGAADRGQGAVAADGQVVAVEDVTGTDALLARIAGLRSALSGGVLVKVSKPGQERRADLPTIGVASIENAARAGLSGIAIEAGSSLIVDRDAVIAAADNAGLFIVGIKVDAPLIYLIAGEPSGDLLGARLMAALKRRGPVAFAGVGGPKMTEQGLSSLFPMHDLSVMGVAEVLPHLPKLLGRIRQTRADVRARRPAVLITIDAPDFCFRVAAKLRGEGIKLVHYVAPSVWAWKPGRAKKIAGFLDHLLALLPFEPAYFERHGLNTSFIGHSVIESAADSGDGPGFRSRHGVAEDAPLLAVLPGSRGGEISRLLPIFAETVAMLAADRPGLRVVVPTLEGRVREIEAAVADWPIEALVVSGEAEKFDAFAAADMALAASGTVALELAMAQTPMVIAYKFNPLTGLFARLLVKTPYANLVNIVLGRRAVPEFIMGDCRADLLKPAVAGLLDDENACRAQIEASAEALKMLGKGGPSPSGRAADVIMELLSK
ncbi:MAG: lipid-A-disaccharide synthase, partial [Alphaproteobacteria bacterium]